MHYNNNRIKWDLRHISGYGYRVNPPPPPGDTHES